MTEKETGLDRSRIKRYVDQGASARIIEEVERLQAELTEVKAHYAVDTEVLDAVGTELEDVEYLGGYSDGVKKMKAELAECHLERDSSKNNWEVAERVVTQLQKELAEWKDCALNGGATQTMVKQNTALALRVKALREALSSLGPFDSELEKEALEALSTSDRTSEEVIAEHDTEVLGEPVAEVMVRDLSSFLVWADEGRRPVVPDGTKLYAPKVKK